MGWVALAFGLTSAVYLVWLDRLILLVGPPAADGLSLTAGYLLQAVGLCLACLYLKRVSPTPDDPPDAVPELRRSFILAVLLFAVVAVPAMMTDSVPAVIAFGLLMNLLCGVIAGFYLWEVCFRADPRHRGRVFCGGYAAATFGVGLLAVARLMRGWAALSVCLVLAGALIWATLRFGCLGLPGKPSPGPSLDPSAKEMPTPKGDGQGTQLLLLTVAAVLLISLVKNLGFNFPSADVQAGLIPEIARIPYGAGLLAAGFINDRSRKNGLVCAGAAMIVPFLMLGLIHEPISSAVFWGLNYVFYAFFTAFRVVAVMDIVCPEGAADMDRRHLAPAGLLAGRIGDAVGSGIGLLLAGHQTALVVSAAALFIPAVFVLCRLYERLFMPKAVRQRSEKEVFETFCLHNDLTFREREVLERLLAGETNAGIGEALFISENTVKYHVKNILQKTGCRNRGELQKRYTQLVYPGGTAPEPVRAGG